MGWASGGEGGNSLGRAVEKSKSKTFVNSFRCRGEGEPKGAGMSVRS